jgi:threonine/homoserine/homoserine lactone efflux protein
MMWLYLLQGIGFGFAAASQPGPLQTFLISQALTRGWKRALPAALAPLISDGPIILLSVLLLSQLPEWLQRALYIIGGLFVLYLAYGAFKSWRKYDEATMRPELSGQQTVLKAALTNALAPGAYIFWMFVTGPILLHAWREAALFGAAFLAGFYLTMIGGLAVIILVFGIVSQAGPRLNRAMLGISTLALLVFGLYQLWQGLSG